MKYAPSFSIIHSTPGVGWIIVRILPGNHHETIHVGPIILEMFGDIVEIGSFQIFVCS